MRHWPLVILGTVFWFGGCDVPDPSAPVSPLDYPNSVAPNSVVLPTTTTIIDFDGEGVPQNGYLALDQYASDGVLFSSEDGTEAYIRALSTASVFDYALGHTSSPPGAVAGGAPYYEYLDVVATFVDPATGAPATTSFVQVVGCSGIGGDPLSENVALVAFDAFGNEIARDDAEDTAQYEVLTVATAGISTVRLIAGDQLDVFDDFTFAPPQPVLVSYTNPTAFADAASEYGTPLVVDFEDIAVSSGSATYLGHPEFDGEYYSSQGVTFSSPHGYPLVIAPAGLWWNASNSLSIGRFPFDGAAGLFNNDDDLGIAFDPPCTAVGLVLVDNDTRLPEESVRFLDAQGEVMLEVPLPPDWETMRAFVGVITAGLNIAAVNVVEKASDVDDVNYDDIVCYRSSGGTNHPPTISVAGPYSGTEGSPVTFDFNSNDPDADALGFTWDLGDGTTESGSELLTNHTYADDGSYEIVLTADDGNGGTATATTTATISNVAPVVTPLSVTVAGATLTGPIPVGTTVTASASFTDPGTADTHSGTFQWDATGTSEASSAATIVGNAASGSMLYTEPGVYAIRLDVTDDDGGLGSSPTYEYVVAYDPVGGFVTGGGWIMSPEGACHYAACTEMTTGKASFGFVSKYKAGATTPEGNTEFQFKAGALNFKSNAYQWLVIAGARAMFKGTGAINGGGDFGFLLYAIDGALPGGVGEDKFRIKIWDRSDDDRVIYDNEIGVGEDVAPTTLLGGGSIQIHKK